MDEKLTKLFKPWLAAFEAVEAATREEDAVAARDVLADVEARIAATPAEGLRGLVVKLGPWLLILAIVCLSVISPEFRISTKLPQPIEHFLIFLLTAFAFGLRYPYHHPAQGVALVLFAAAIELVQVWVPGRHSRLSDLVVGGVLGVVVGIGLGLRFDEIDKAQLGSTARTNPKDIGARPFPTHESTAFAMWDRLVALAA